MVIIEFIQWVFQGTRGNIVSAVIGGCLVALFTFYLQGRLLAQQLKAQENSHQELLAFEKRKHADFLVFLEEKILVSLLIRWVKTFEQVHTQLDEISGKSKEREVRKGKE